MRLGRALLSESCILARSSIEGDAEVEDTQDCVEDLVRMYVDECENH